MTKVFIFIEVIGILSTISFAFDINFTSVNFIMAQEARLLVGQPSSHFPNEAFLCSILYGHSDVNFTYKDFLTSYGKVAKEPFEGYLIIGNDYKLGGMVLSEEKSVVVPIPGGKITEVPMNTLSKYFPNGYTFLESKSSEYLYGYGEENSYYHKDMICQDCYSGFEFAYDMEINIFQNNFFWGKWVLSNIKGIDIEAYGYLEEYNNKTSKGNVKIYFYQVDFQEEINYHLTNDKYYNNYSISFIGHKNLTYEGSLWTQVQNTSHYYNFSGWWIPN